jgi:hypothetical protein
MAGFPASPTHALTQISSKKTTHSVQLSFFSPKRLRLQKYLVQNASSFPFGEYACGTNPPQTHSS